MKRFVLGLFLLLACWAPPRGASAYAIDCRNAEYMESFAVPGVGAQRRDCDVLRHFTLRWNGNTADVRVIKLPGPAVPNQDAELDAISLAIDHIGAAMSVMGSVAERPISILLLDERSAGETTAAQALGTAADCAIPFFRMDSLPSAQAARAVLAHEIFHCVQSTMWPLKMKPEARGWWWAEGSATYFAYLAEPGTTGDEQIAVFDGAATSTSLVDMPNGYPAVVFFAWLAQTRGAAAVTDFLSHMAESAEHVAQVIALRALIGNDAWLAFEVDYLSHTIALPGGRLLPTPPPPPVETQTFQTNVGVDIILDDPEPYMVHTQSFVFLQGARYDLLPERQNPDAPMRWREEPGGMFGPLLTSVDACTTTKTFTITWAQSLPPTPYPMTFAIRPRSDACPCEVRGDCPPEEFADSGDYGEPHLVTYDGLEYSFQAVGEFVLTRAASGFEIQTRQERGQGFSVNEVAVNGAVAIKLGAHRVAIYAHDFPRLSIAKSRVWVDGAPVVLGDAGLALGDATIRNTDVDAYEIERRDGARLSVVVQTVDKYRYLDLQLHMPKRGGPYTGLLGDFDGNPKNDLRTAAGEVVAPDHSAYEGGGADAGAQAYFERLNGKFGDSWRISASNSLFDYGAGQSTATFTDRAFPKAFLSLSSFNQGALNRASAACTKAGVPESLMHGCMFDVAVTGKNDFAASLGGKFGQAVKDRLKEELQKRLPGRLRLP